MYRLAAVASLLCPAALPHPLFAQIPEQYPRPLVHTPTNHPAAHIILVSVDGLHAFDLANYVVSHPHSSLAALSAHGVTYTNAHAPWADPVAGLASLLTGGTPISTGIIAGDGYDHSLSPPGSHCNTRGTTFLIDQADSRSTAPLDPANGCEPVLPHQLLRVNTIFEVVHGKIGPTAWAGDSVGVTDLIRGPSHKGLDNAVTYRPLSETLQATHAADSMRLDAVLHWIDGRDATGSVDSPVPILFGLNIASVATAQSTPGTGYLDAGATPSPALARALDWLDTALGRISAELAARKLSDSTWVVLAAPAGQQPIDPQHRRIVTPATLAAALGPGNVAHISGGDIALIWLKDPSLTPAALKSLQAKAAPLGIEDILAGERLALILNRPDHDPRMPDIILQPAQNVVYAPRSTTAIAAHGGLRDANTHVAMLISGAQLTGRTDSTWVPTTQLAPLLLRALGMEKFDLDALHLEHSPALPGIF